MSAPVKVIWNESVNKLEGNLDDLARWKRPDLPAGSACWAKGTDDQIAALRFTCPCGCGDVCTVPVRPGYTNTHWNWDGNLELPSLTPSIQRLGDCRWHGYLTKGEFVTC